MYKVLHIMAGADSGGISMVVLNYYRHMDRTLIHFDIAVTTDQIGKNAEEFQRLGSRIFRLPLKSNGVQQYKRALSDLIKSNGYDAVHVHENQTSYVALHTAKKMGVVQRIAHAHTAWPCTSLRGRLTRISGCIFNPIYATEMIACGELAGNRIFGRYNMRRKKAIVLPNAINTSVFSYNMEVRQSMRQELDIQDRYVIGMVGRLSREKNQEYALELMRQIHQQDENAVLLIVGNGKDDLRIRDYIITNKMDSYVRMLGSRSDVDRMYQAFDVLVMPSLFEGFPVVAVEAIASGLPVVLSATITNELSFSPLVYYTELEQPTKWVDLLLSVGRGELRMSQVEELRQQKLDIQDTACMLQHVYLRHQRG